MGDDVRAGVCSMAQSVLAGYGAERAGRLADALEQSALLPRFGLDEAGLVALAADVAEEGELESRFRAVVLHVRCE